MVTVVLNDEGYEPEHHLQEKEREINRGRKSGIRVGTYNVQYSTWLLMGSFRPVIVL